MSGIPKMPAFHLFKHEAMNTTFCLRLCEEDQGLAAGMAKECFDQIDFLESRLSRYAEGSDISCINDMKAGEILYISEVTHQCLLQALDAHTRTGGLFDVTLGNRIEHQKNRDVGAPPPLDGSIVIHPDSLAVSCLAPGRQLDLGGIGKGFALDHLRQILLDWGSQGGMLSAGASSLLAFGPQVWPVDLTGGEQPTRIKLRDSSLSASGTAIQGSHIVHPAGAEAMPATACTHVWVTAPTAALAEIWSTSLMLLDPKDIQAFVAGEETLCTVHVELNGAIDEIKLRES